MSDTLQPAQTEKVGVAVPCYLPHLQKLLRLLNSIASQTKVPDVVVVSSSNTSPADVEKEGLDKLTLPFTLQLLTVPTRQNAAQNRNIAIKHLLDQGCTIISVFDADDVMHTQRMEFVLHAINTGGDLVFHNFTDHLTRPLPVYASPPHVEVASVRPKDGSCQCEHAGRKPIHHSQVTFSAAVAKEVAYREGREFERAEDSWFCSDVLRAGFTSAYIENVLSRYDAADAWVSFE